MKAYVNRYERDDAEDRVRTAVNALQDALSNLTGSHVTGIRLTTNGKNPNIQFTTRHYVDLNPPQEELPA